MAYFFPLLRLFLLLQQLPLLIFFSLQPIFFLLQLFFLVLVKLPLSMLQPPLLQLDLFIHSRSYSNHLHLYINRPNKVCHLLSMTRYSHIILT